MIKASSLSDRAITIICPVFNDWQALCTLLVSIDEMAAAHEIEVSVLAVDDGSLISFEDEVNRHTQYKAIRRFDILELGRNLGHQRAITIALSYVEENQPCEAIVVMDADGEDDPKYIPTLLEKFKGEHGKKIVFASRKKRSEGVIFRLSYGIYKQLYKLFTGSCIRVGNFCIIPYSVLPKVVLLSEIWNHFSAGILRARVPYVEIPTERSKRLGGQSKMNFVSLVMHGLSAISVHADTLGIRALIATGVIMLVAVLAIMIVVSIKLLTNMAIPGWASTLTLLFFLVFMQALTVSVFFIFLVLNGRNSLSFLPKRDYHFFVRRVHSIFP